MVVRTVFLHRKSEIQFTFEISFNVYKDGK